MRIHWLLVAMKIVLLAAVVKIVLVLLVLLTFVTTRYWRPLFRRTPA
jgi:hypothetical protein